MRARLGMFDDTHTSIGNSSLAALCFGPQCPSLLLFSLFQTVFFEIDAYNMLLFNAISHPLSTDIPLGMMALQIFSA